MTETATKPKQRAVRATDPATEALRRQVPDDPIKLPSGHLACEACGVAHAGESILSIPLGHDSRFSADYTRCPDCQRLNDLAAGDERTRSALYALAVIGKPIPSDPRPLVPWLHLLGSKAEWLDPDAPLRGYCNPHPFAHVGIGHRAKIREALGLAMRSRIQIGAPLDLPPPWGRACLFCGIATVPMAPLDVVRRGGREAAALTIWRGVVTQPKALGGSGPDMIDGFVCPTCAEAFEDSAGSVRRACALAFEKHAKSNGIPVPSNLDDLYLDGHPLVVTGWAALPTLVPNPSPWAHVEVVDEPQPVPEIGP